MTNEQRNKITELRQNNICYTAIALITGLSKDSVKSYCRLHNLAGVRAENKMVNSTVKSCLFCGKKILQNPTRKEKKFCSDKCRMKWWNSNTEFVRRKKLANLVCQYCGQIFTSKNATQKYCSRKCYAKARKEQSHNE